MLAWVMSEPGHAEGIHHDVSRQVLPQRPPHHLATEQVNDHGQEQPTVVCGDVGDVADPEQRALLFVLINTSGSIDDAIPEHFISEALIMSRKTSRGLAPDVVIIFADSVARGEPVFVTEKNDKQLLQLGIQYGGRYGTRLEESIRNIFELVKQGSKSGHANRGIDAIAYMTDTGDDVPDRQALFS